MTPFWELELLGAEFILPRLESWISSPLGIMQRVQAKCKFSKCSALVSIRITLKVQRLLGEWVRMLLFDGS